ncbi:MAG: M14 family metallopeptidase [Bacteroidales bacterium]|jgi:hypothetical protein|nr:M14 family metallopeptidase [Bacteroidales bacterium]
MLKRILGGLLVLIIVSLIGFTSYSYLIFNTYAPSDGEVQVDRSLLEYYSENYDQARVAFKDATEALSSTFAKIEHQSIKVPSKVDTALYVDMCYIPPQGETRKLVIMTSGLHGVEGYTGSALQLMFLEKMKTMEGIEDMGFLFIHAMNPYGFKYHRKATENNVDLNRNCMLTPVQFNTENEGFGQLYDMLTPAGEVAINSLWNRSFHLVAIEKIIQKSMPVLRQAALQGQYDYPEGIYYGSKDYEPQITSVMPKIKKYINQYPTVLNVDLHTGYGKRGQLHLFIDRPEEKVVEQGIERIFEGQKIDWSEGADFYTINGEYIGLVAAQADSALVIPMLMEFGTMNSQETFGSLKSIHIMICENQGFNNGFKNARSEKKVKSDMMELYAPTSEVWRSETIRKGEKSMAMMMERFIAF